tara:strand:- start:565 stop:711 length:147 start_codon:yes stop_codon:yes gene_type:complete
VVFYTVGISILKTFKASKIQNTGAWVLEKGFSIETRGWDLICNPFSIS